MTLNPGDIVSVAGYRGIAFYVRGPHVEIRYDDEPFMYCEEDHEHDESCYSWDEEGYDHDTGELVVVMVGDDREHYVDPDDCTPIDEDDYCSGCGQIGCDHG